jgi:8-oxo-dGTP pyrophosphatase MutT (NUDIX family)
MVAEARPAASLILLRRGGKHTDRGLEPGIAQPSLAARVPSSRTARLPGSLEVLLVRRSHAARFMPGVWVFPGGAVDAADAGGAEAAHMACAVRELREEASIELPPSVELLAWSRWITPEPVPVRFDTRFYLAVAPPHSPPRPDGREVTEAGWFAPAAALERHATGELDLVFPTIKHLESLLPYSSSAEVLEAARNREVEPVMPRVVGSGDDRRIVLPGEPGY